MFTSAFICADSARRQVLYQLAVESGLFRVLGSTDGYPRAGGIAHVCGYVSPDILFLDLDSPDDAVRCLGEFRSTYPNASVIAFGSATQAAWGAPGGGEFLVLPCNVVSFSDAVRRVLQARTASVIPGLIAFLPAKAGCGATTAALCTATCLGAHFGRPSLLLDTDLRSSVLAAMLDQPPRSSTQFVLNADGPLDRAHWSALVNRCYGIEVLPASEKVPERLPDWHQYHAILRTADSQYDFVVADLPELVNRATHELVRRARLVFVVTTQEVPALTLAKRRLADLRTWEVPEERVFLLGNRWHPRDTSVEEVEEIVQRPLFATIPNDYRTLREALTEERFPLDPKRGIGEAYTALCRAIQESGGERHRSAAPPASSDPAGVRPVSRLGHLFGGWRSRAS